MGIAASSHAHSFASLTDKPNTLGGYGITAQSADYSAFYLLAAALGAVNGVASLDSNGKVPLTQISDAVLGQVEYKGTWNASTNSPTLPTTPAKKGDYYVVSTAGTRFSLDFAVGDWCISNGTAWQKVDNTDAVMTVFGRLGNVVAQQADYEAFYSLLGHTHSYPVTSTFGRTGAIVAQQADYQSYYSLLGHVHSIAQQIKGAAELVISSNATTLNCANAITAYMSINGNITLNISNMLTGMYMDIRVIVTGTRTITLGTLTDNEDESPTRIGINGSLSNITAGHYHIGFSYIIAGANRYLDINIAQY